MVSHEPVFIHGAALYNIDCVEGARRHLQDGSVDLIFTDPPYGIQSDRLHLHYNRDEGYVLDGYVEVRKEEYAEFSERWIKEAERVLRPGGSLYVVSGYTHLYEILHALRKTSLREVNHLVWRYSFGVFTKRKYISSHYHILFYEKPGGERTFNAESRFGFSERSEDGRSPNSTDREDVWMINREYKPGRQKNRNELPIELVTKALQYSSREGDLICDFFLGGFTTAKAAIGLGRRFVGFELSPEIFRARIDEIRSLEEGWLLPKVRKPHLSSHVNRHKRWTEGERVRLKELYSSLKEQGCSKKEILEITGRELGRGRWGLERAIRRFIKKKNPNIEVDTDSPDK
ncbi:MAG: site-specific DNA-methyltransferase [Methanomicrobiales archaeon]|nr:site-specific DNA-methyltransferase [Methanomicrobiales archaeon]